MQTGVGVNKTVLTTLGFHWFTPGSVFKMNKNQLGLVPLVMVKTGIEQMGSRRFCLRFLR
jgi:hypothetical protein